MTPRERFLIAIRNGKPDQMALTIWNNKLPGGVIDDQLLNLEVCVVVKSSVWRMEYSGLKIEYKDEKLSEIHTLRTMTYHTKHGKLQETRILEPGTSWIKVFPFKNAGDYKALETMIRCREYYPDYEKFIIDDKIYGDQSIARPVTIHSPLHELIYEFMGMETFSYEYAVNPERVLKLETVLKADWQKRMTVLAESPAKYAVIEGNTDYRVVGPDMFYSHYYPNINEACAILRKKGIYAGAHLDSNNRNLAPLFAETGIEFVESFTPPPDCDMTITEARKAWPDKALLVHFPSTVHLGGESVVKNYAKKLGEEVKNMAGVTIGVSEDLPGRGISTLIPMFTVLREMNKINSP